MPRDPAEIDQLVNRFRRFLTEQTPAAADPTVAPAASAIALHTEMTQLKSEVRREARLFKDGMQAFNGACHSLEESRRAVERISAEQQTGQEEQADQRVRELMRPMLRDMIELCDKLRAEERYLANLKPNWAGRVLGKQETLLRGLREGRDAMLHRLEQQLQDYGLELIPVRDLPFDGRFMKVGEVVHREDLEDGVVIEELLPGYTWRDEVLRHAEVRVNRHAADGGGDDGA